MKYDWIFYREKVPDKYEDCWVCQFDETISKACYFNDHSIYGSGFGNDEEFIEEKCVKCWMPYFTPEPPK